jgi:hypothetical protein
MSKEIAKPSKDKFRETLQDQLMYHYKYFWDNLFQLKPKDFCDTYLKLLPYAFSKVPEEKPLDEEGKQRLILEETTRKATLISGGLPEVENMSYEEDN